MDRRISIALAFSLCVACQSPQKARKARAKKVSSFSKVKEASPQPLYFYGTNEPERFVYPEEAQAKSGSRMRTLASLMKGLREKRYVGLSYTFDIDEEDESYAVTWLGIQLYKSADSGFLGVVINKCQIPEEIHIWCRRSAKERWKKKMQSLIDLTELKVYDFEEVTE